ncbi:hypothetical protein LINGRAHAP2_LOCUS6581 [Linum grandiflorum]
MRHFQGIRRRSSGGFRNLRPREAGHPVQQRWHCRGLCHREQYRNIGSRGSEKGVRGQRIRVFLLRQTCRQSDGAEAERDHSVYAECGYRGVRVRDAPVHRVQTRAGWTDEELVRGVGPFWDSAELDFARRGSDPDDY